MINSLDEAITHCLEVAEEQEDFDKFQCGYCKLGCEDGVWKDTCRLSSNIPEGCSWGECSESNCPLFSNCLECAKEHRQLAEWLRELKKWRALRDSINMLCDVDCEYPQYRESGTMCDACPIGTVKEYFEQIFDGEVNADANSD